ncbi:pilin [Nocardia asteroides]|uniref:pilin n=1 Tax=Nocardia asteroides TaxID=1824 RepID=UPI001E47F22F|nr:pilin [Nocardia asteroides]UGT59894.1 pilin [Nocardia asteroides]
MNTNQGNLGAAPQTSARHGRRWTRPLAVLGTTLALLGLLAGSASAAPPHTEVLAIVSSLGEVIDNARNWIVGILAGLATLFLTVAGARYLLGGGDPSEIEKAKTAFRAACLGYALAMLAPVIVAVLKSIIGA